VEEKASFWTPANPRRLPEFFACRVGPHPPPSVEDSVARARTPQPSQRPLRRPDTLASRTPEWTRAAPFARSARRPRYRCSRPLSLDEVSPNQISNRLTRGTGPLVLLSRATRARTHGYLLHPLNRERPEFLQPCERDFFGCLHCVLSRRKAINSARSIMKEPQRPNSGSRGNSGGKR
jgi:hypothetical protein